MDINKFCSHVQAEGFVLYPQNVKADGRWHNCRLVDNAKGKAAGAYKILNDSVAFYKNWRDGKVKAFTDNSIVSKYGRESLQKLIKQQEWELKQQYFEASKLAYDKYMSTPHNNKVQSEYLARKLVGNYGCKIDDNGNLIIPFYNGNGYLRTLQTIQPDGYKVFEKGAEVKGNYHKIHFGLVDKVQSEYYGKIFVGEGYATMASVHEATKYPCVVAANAGNLKPVLEKLTTLYPKAQFIICADNDLSLREHPLGSNQMIWANPGVEAAIECSILKTEKPINILIPDFSHIKEEHGFTDFNDLHCYSGIGAVKNQIMQGIMQLKHTSKLKMDALDNSTDIFKSESEAIINPVNCVGVMGKGLALEFKNRYPDNFKDYEVACKTGKLELGKMFVHENRSNFNSNHKLIINFPTKRHWRDKSELSYIENGLNDLVKVVKEHDIKSVAIPPIGCGLGGLDWKIVKPMIERAFSSLPEVKLKIYEPITPLTHTEAVKQTARQSSGYEMSL